MSVSDKELNNFKQALYIDGNDDDEIIKSYIETAKEYVQNAVSAKADLTIFKQYDFAVQMLSQFWYQNRAIDVQKTPWQVISQIQQLRGKIE